MSFTDDEKNTITAIKHNLSQYLNARGAFWNGVTADCVIAGGYFASAFRSEPFNDIDVFILNKNVNVYAALTDNQFRGKWKIRDQDAGTYLQNPRIFGTATNTQTKVQYILTDYTSRKELLDSFDYLHATVSYVPAENKLYITRGAFDACRKKQLRPNGNNQPKQWRCDKFMKRGWTFVNTDGAGDYNRGLSDGFNDIIQSAVKDMMSRMSPAPAILHEKDIDIEAFKALVK